MALSSTFGGVCPTTSSSSSSAVSSPPPPGWLQCLGYVGNRVTFWKFHLVHILAGCFSRYAEVVYDHAWKFIIISFLASTALGAGLFYRQTECQMYKLYSLPDTPSQAAKAELLSTFTPERISAIFVTSLSDRLNKSTLLRLQELNRRIHEITVDKASVTTDEFGNPLQMSAKELAEIPDVITYEDVCVRDSWGECSQPSVLQAYFSELMYGRDIVARDYPTVFNLRTKRAFRIDSLLGNMTLETRMQGGREITIVKNATAFSLRHDFTGADGWVHFSAAFEQKFLDVVREFDMPGLEVAIKTERSINDELNRSSRMDLPDQIRLCIAVSLVVFYSVFANTSCSFRNKTWVSLMGVLAALLGYVSGTGILHLIGLLHTPPAEATPFLVIGIGVDDVFVMLNSYSLTFLSTSGRDRVCVAVRDAGISITITTLTNIIAFIIGGVSPYFSVSRFCIITAVSLFMGYVMCLTFFLGWLALDARREEQHRLCYSCSYGSSSSSSSSCCNKGCGLSSGSSNRLTLSPAVSACDGCSSHSVSTVSVAGDGFIDHQRGGRCHGNLGGKGGSGGVSSSSCPVLQNTDMVGKTSTYELVARQLMREERNAQARQSRRQLRLYRRTTITSTCENGERVEEGADEVEELERGNACGGGGSGEVDQTGGDSCRSGADFGQAYSSSGNSTKSGGTSEGVGSEGKGSASSSRSSSVLNVYSTHSSCVVSGGTTTPTRVEGGGDGALTFYNHHKDGQFAMEVEEDLRKHLALLPIVCCQPNMNCTNAEEGGEEEEGTTFAGEVMEGELAMFGDGMQAEGVVEEGTAVVKGGENGSGGGGKPRHPSGVLGGSMKGEENEEEEEEGLGVEERWGEDENYLDEPKGNVGSMFRRFFLLYYGRWLMLWWVKVIILICFTIYVVGALLGLKQLKSGLSLRDVTPDKSYLREFYDSRDVYFTSYGEEVVVFFPGVEEWWKKEVQDEFLQVKDRINRSDYCVFMVEAMSTFIDEKRAVLQDGNREQFNYELANWLENESSGRRYRTHFKFIGSEMVAWKFYYWMPFIDNTRISHYWLEDVRQILKNSSDHFRGLAFTPLSVMWESDPRILEYTLTNMAIALAAIVLVATLLIPDILSAVLVVLMIVMVDLGLFGYMTYWNLELNMLTMVNLLISIGFSVDYTAHMVHTFTHCVGSTRQHRIIETLVIMGNPVTHGMISTLLAVLVLAAADKYALVVFFQMMTMVLLFAFAHGVILLPVILSVIGPMPHQREAITPPRQHRQLSPSPTRKGSCFQMRIHRKR